MTALKEIVPWRWGGLRRWEQPERPFESFLNDMGSLQREMDRLFDEFWKGSTNQGFMTQGLTAEPFGYGMLNPVIDVSDDDNAFHVRAELPGMSKEDVDITLANGLLTIRGEKKQEDEEKGKNFYRQERAFGTFSRTLQIPVDVDESKIEARFENGVLNIDLPKTEEARSHVKHIEVKAA